MAGFNFGGEQWMSFDEIFSETYSLLTSLYPGKPLMLADFCSAQMPSPKGDDKAGWIEDAFGRIRSDYPKIGAFIWFNENKLGVNPIERDWRVDSSPESLAAYRAAIAHSHYLSEPEKR